MLIILNQNPKLNWSSSCALLFDNVHYNNLAQNALLKAELKEFYLRYNATYHEKDDNRMYAMQDSLVHEYCTESFYSAYLAEIKENGRGWEEFIALVSSDDINIIKKTFKVRRIANRQYGVEYQILDSDINHKVIKELVSLLFGSLICIL